AVDLVEVTNRGILCILCVEPGCEPHKGRGDEHGISPGIMRGIAEADDGREDDGHHHIRYAAAEVTPAAGDGVGGAFDAGGEHHGGVVLGDDEGSADDADGQAEEQEADVVRCQAGECNGDRADEQEVDGGFTWAVNIAKFSYDESGDDGGGYRGDDGVAHLCFGEAEVGADGGHQRCETEPAEEADEEHEPRDVEGPHLDGV